MIDYALRLGVDKPIQNRTVTLRKGEKGNARLTMHVYQVAEELDLTLYDVALCVMPHGYELPCSVLNGEVVYEVEETLTAIEGDCRAYLRLSYDETDVITTQTFDIEVMGGIA